MEEWNNKTICRNRRSLENYCDTEHTDDFSYGDSGPK